MWWQADAVPSEAWREVQHPQSGKAPAALAPAAECTSGMARKGRTRGVWLYRPLPWQVYYYHTKTKKTQWTKPDELLSEAACHCRALP